MKILHRQIVNNLTVGLVPIMLIITVIFFVNRSQTEKNIRRQMSAYIENFRSFMDTDLGKYRDYAYFIGAESEDFIVNGKWTTSDFPVNIESFDMRLYEVFFEDRLLYHDMYSWQDNIYFASPDRANYIWSQLSHQKHSIFFKMSFPEVHSNALVIRNAAILTKMDFKRIGFISVIAPMDTTYLSKIPFTGQDIILFVQTASNITFSDPTFQTEKVVSPLRKFTVGETIHQTGMRFDELGKFYYYKESLYSERIKVSNRFVKNHIADVGILYRHQAANRDFLLYQRIIFIILMISLLAFPIISYFSGKRLSRPILELIKQVDRFKSQYTVVDKPAHVSDEISMLHQSFSEMSHTVIQKSEDLTDALTELARANETLGEMTITDGLTGVNNRRFFNKRIETEIKRATRLNETLSLMMVDIDFFKKINDTYGHEAGDCALQQIAVILKKHAVRSGDSVNRYGGEEFSLILPNTDIKGAKLVAERIRKEIESTPMKYKRKVIKLTVSIGVAGFTAKDETECLENIVSYADAALYQAKDTGRNKVIVYKKGAFKKKKNN